MKIKLVRPTKELKEKALDYRKEHFDNKEKIIYGSELFDQIDSYEEWLDIIEKNAKKETVDPEWVLTDTFFAIREDDNKIIGIIDLRHQLKGFLKDFGNTGYSVRPSERRKGYATEMLRQLKEFAKTCNMEKLQLAAEKENIPSIKTIIKNGGVLERTFDLDGDEAEVYMIKL